MNALKCAPQDPRCHRCQHKAYGNAEAGLESAASGLGHAGESKQGPRARRPYDTLWLTEQTLTILINEDKHFPPRIKPPARPAVECALAPECVESLHYSPVPYRG